MEVMGVLLFVGIIAVVYFIQKAIGKGVSAGTKALNRNVLYRREYAEANQMLGETVEYRSRIDAGTALDLVMSKLSAAPPPGVFRSQLTVARATPASLRFTVANKMATHLEGLITAESDGVGSRLKLEVHRWVEADGMPVARENLKWVREDVGQALRSQDPQVSISATSN